MKNMIYFKYIKPAFYICLLLLSIFWGCDKSPYVIDTLGEPTQLYLLSNSTESVTTLHPSFEYEKYRKDSSLTLEYQKYEDISGSKVDTNELFSTDLSHKLNYGETLDYGKVIFAITDKGISWAVSAIGIKSNYSYNFNSRMYNNSAGVNSFYLGGNYLMNCTKSSMIEDLSFVFKTGIPNEITSIKSGQTIDLTADLEIKFAYVLPKGSLLTLGYGQNFICIEPLQSCSSLVIFKDDLQRLKWIVKKEGVERCQIGLVEGSIITYLRSVDKRTLKILLMNCMIAKVLYK